MIEAIISDSMPEDLMLVREGANAAELRLQFMTAISAGDYEAASFLLGRLDEQDHDPGELAFLTALAAFASGKVDRVLRHVELVPREAVDRPRAAWLAAKSAAQKGDLEALELYLDEIGATLTPCAWVHLAELLTSERCDDFEVISQRLPDRLTVTPADPAYDEWVRLHVKLLERFYRYLEEIKDAHSAMDEPPSAEALEADIARKDFRCAFLVESPDTLAVPAKIAARLNPLIRSGDLAALRSGVELLEVVQDWKGILDLARLFPGSPPALWRQDLSVASAIYVAATLAGDRRQERELTRVLGDSLASAGSDASRLQIASDLVPMARLSLLSAFAELDAVVKSDNLWRDCGLISLGFFRALEVELNAKIVKPLGARLNADDLRAQLPDGEKPLKAALKELKYIASGSQNMMLGPMRNLLTQIARKDATNAGTVSVLQAMRHEFDRLTSGAKIDQEPIAAVCAMIDSDAVARFRNPPAHGQFLGLETSKGAAQHVSEALRTLKALFSARG